MNSSGTFDITMLNIYNPPKYTAAQAAIKEKAEAKECKKSCKKSK